MKSWIATAAAGTIKTSIIASDKNPADPDAFPLAVEPTGGSVIVTGPIDRETGRNVVWIVGSAINMAWLASSGDLVGRLHVWEQE